MRVELKLRKNREPGLIGVPIPGHVYRSYVNGWSNDLLLACRCVTGDTDRIFMVSLNTGRSSNWDDFGKPHGFNALDVTDQFHGVYVEK